MTMMDSLNVGTMEAAVTKYGSSDNCTINSLALNAFSIKYTYLFKTANQLFSVYFFLICFDANNLEGKVP